MKHLFILITVLLLVTPTCPAAWFFKAQDPTLEYKEKITVLENQLSTQAITLNRWQIATGSLAVVSVVLFIIGTALGSITRKHYDSTTRMGAGRPTPTQPLNGTKLPRKVGQRNG